MFEALKSSENTMGIPVIMVTAKQFSDGKRAQLNAHALSVVSKSELHHNRFLSEVRRACRHPNPTSCPKPQRFLSIIACVSVGWRSMPSRSSSMATT